MTIRRFTYAMLLGLGIVITSGSAGIVRADMLGVNWFGNAYVIDETTAEVIASGPTGFFRLNSLARDSTGQFFTVGTSTQGDGSAEQISAVDRSRHGHRDTGCPTSVCRVRGGDRSRVGVFTR